VQALLGRGSAGEGDELVTPSTPTNNSGGIVLKIVERDVCFTNSKKYKDKIFYSVPSREGIINIVTDRYTS
jgi:hypothetical protein